MRGPLRGIGGLAAGLAVAAVAVAAGPFVLDTYLVNVLIRAFLYALVAMTVDILWGYTGILTFGQAAFFGIGAYAAALVFTHLGFTPATIALAVTLSLAAPAVAGLVVGWLSFYPGSTPLYASVVSLAFPIVVTQVIFSGGTFTGSSSGLVGYPVFDLSVEAWFWIVGGVLVAAAGLGYVFVHSEMARTLVAIRDNEMRCSYLGIDAPRLKILLTAALAAVAGLAGFGYANYSGVVAPEIAGFVFGTVLVIYVALGGRATLVGPLIGTILIDTLSAYLSGDLPYVWQLVVGLVFIVVIVALPNGFAPLIAGAWRRLAPRRDGGGRPAVRIVRAGSAAAVPPSATLEIVGVAKSFGSLKVLEDIHLSVVDGELVSLVGPNGAGKTTLMRCISDGRERSSGLVRVNGTDIAGMPPHRVVGLGLGRKFQTAGIFESLTVAECLRMARLSAQAPSFLHPIDAVTLPQAARAVVETTGLADALALEAKSLSHGQKQALELAMVLALEPQIVLLDEPTAGLTKAERTRIGGILTELAARHRLAVILVEHDLDFVREISSRVVVLHQGRIVLDGTVDAVVGSELVRTIYAGAGHG
ncbi:MAG: branched-chain amino acid ABC transporter ATP-binding protein/permease [Xanthobacteraceae bacterium]